MIARIASAYIDFTLTIATADVLAEFTIGAAIAHAFTQRRAVPVAVAGGVGGTLIFTSVANPATVADTLAVHAHTSVQTTAFHFVGARMSSEVCVTLAGAIRLQTAVPAADGGRAEKTTLRKGTFEEAVKRKVEIRLMV